MSLDNDRRMQRETIDCFITFLHEKWHDSLSDYQQSKSPTLPKEITDLKFHLRYTAWLVGLFVAKYFRDRVTLTKHKIALNSCYTLYSAKANCP